MNHSYLVVEGPHDVEVIGRLLKDYGFSRIEQLDDLDDFWDDVIPKNFPPEGNLLKRVSIPTFFQRDDYSIAVHSAGGISKIPKVLRLTLLNIMKPNSNLLSVGVVIDADNQLAYEQCKKMIGMIGDGVMPFSSIEGPGHVTSSSPRLGIHVFPDNNNVGTLENALIDCAGIVYPSLLDGATNYLKGVEKLYRDKWGATDEVKALVGCIANVLRPGKANQVSLQDNEWISSKTENVPAVIALKEFLTNLLNL